MKRIAIGVVLLFMIVTIVGACGPVPSASPSVSTGTFQLYVTDAPPDREVTSIMVTMSEVQIHRAEAEQEQEQQRGANGSQSQTQEQEQEQNGSGEWVNISLNENVTFDLLQIQGVEQSLGASEIDTGRYTQVRLVVESVQVALDGGELQDAKLPSGELKINHAFDMQPDEITQMVLDFEADKMVTITGNGQIIVKPVVKVTTRQGKKQQGQGAQNATSQPAGGAGLGISCDEFTASKNITRDLQAAVGDEIEVILCSNATTGFQWDEQAQIGDDSVIEQIKHKYTGPGGQGKTPAPGAPGKEEWAFKVLKQGTTTIYFEYSQPWEGGQKAEWTLELTVIAE